MSTPVQLSDQERYGVFRELHIPEKVRRGWVIEETRNQAGPPKYIMPHGDLPKGIIGQQIRYWIRLEGGGRWELVKAHQYRLPDGQIRGGPDPLYIRLHDVVLTRTERHGSARSS